MNTRRSPAANSLPEQRLLPRLAMLAVAGAALGLGAVHEFTVV